MKKDSQDNYIILEDDKNNLYEFVNTLEKQVSEEFSDSNIIVNLLSFGDLGLQDLLLFLNLSNSHRENKYSFVIVTNSLNPDDLPDELVIVPTIHEAGDIIEMEEMERQLGF